MQRVIAIPSAPERSLFRASSADAVVAALAACVGLVELALATSAARAGALGLATSAAVVALGIVWTSNTIAHIHLHTPLFRRRGLNATFSLFLSAVVQIPQSLWKHRHLAHHAGTTPKSMRWSPTLQRELVVVVAAFVALASCSPRYFFFAHLPGYLAGLALCHLSGVLEHRANGDVAPSGVSTYGRLYNLTWLNDGFHREHHASPAAHWTTLPARRAPGGPVSAHAPLLRALDEPWMAHLLGLLERVVLTQAWLGRWVVTSHARAIAPLLAALPTQPRRVAIVGGGLFPRTALVFRLIAPACQLTIIDKSAASLAVARRALGADARPITFVEGAFDPETHVGFDLVVLPLALVSSGRELSSRCPTLVHSWLSRRLEGPSRVVSWLLWKKVTLLGRPCA